ncbi:MAG: hypothetical protein CL677_07165 [Bdellovibrionaceae bacterium]|nr:hypothetical protein [Pseudobdellovibrionaceae bacterium]|tara:strand:+ start:40247 stop:40453 length:207 start_codon:yes stop_codon:yes gene_type:complete
MLGERFANFIIATGFVAASVSLFMLFGPSDSLKNYISPSIENLPKTSAAKIQEPRQPVSLDADIEVIE